MGSPENDAVQVEIKTPESQSVCLYGLQFLFWHFPQAGGRINPHQHPFEHGSILLRGTFRVEGDLEGRSGVDIKGIDVVRFPANSPHSMLAKTDGAICLHIYPLNRIILEIWKRFKRRKGADMPLQDISGGG